MSRVLLKESRLLEGENIRRQGRIEVVMDLIGQQHLQLARGVVRCRVVCPRDEDVKAV